MPLKMHKSHVCKNLANLVGLELSEHDVCCTCVKIKVGAGGWRPTNRWQSILEVPLYFIYLVPYVDIG